MTGELRLPQSKLSELDYTIESYEPTEEEELYSVFIRDKEDLEDDY